MMQDSKLKNYEDEIIAGRNPVLEAIKSGRALNKIYVQKPAADGALRAIVSAAKIHGIPLLQVEKPWLDRYVGGVHQGVAASASVKDYCDVSDILNYAHERNESLLIIIANGILDPNNLGSIIRSAEAAGAHGVIIPKRNAAGLTGAVAKSSSGAVEYMRVARATNIAELLRSLKKQGVWIVGADAAGATNYTDCDMTAGVAIVIGGESSGLGRLVGEICDYVVKLPMRGRIASLNAAAAASVLLYEALRQRGRAAN